MYDGATRGEAARIGGVTMQIVRDWVERFNAHGPEGLLNVKAPAFETQRRSAPALVLL
ncbi:helix-turn-helix domain-containing protein [Pararhizobium sp. DWP3-4]|uniref:helix-turn-helix domain-containing protein n=1 Tax=Pararhizobium sp. DWP3-4 TaxID=2804565 RepID=UPI003CEC3E27